MQPNTTNCLVYYQEEKPTSLFYKNYCKADYTSPNQHSRKADMTIGDEIKRRRKKLGLTQTELANLAGTGQQTISHLESNRIDTTLKLVDIAKALGCRAEDLKRESHSSNEPESDFEKLMQLSKKLSDDELRMLILQLEGLTKER